MESPRLGDCSHLKHCAKVKIKIQHGTENDEIGMLNYYYDSKLGPKVKNIV